MSEFSSVYGAVYGVSGVSSLTVCAVIIVIAILRPCLRRMWHCFNRYRNRHAQSTLLEPMVRMPSSLEDHIVRTTVLRETVEEISRRRAEDEFGSFGTFVSIFGMQWICGKSVTRYRKFNVGLFVTVFMILWMTGIANFVFRLIYLKDNCSILETIRTLLADRARPFNWTLNEQDFDKFKKNICVSLHGKITEQAWPIFFSIISLGLVMLHWKRFTNPVTAALIQMQQLLPQQYLRCCNIATWLTSILVIFSIICEISSFVIPIFYSRKQNEEDGQFESSQKLANSMVGAPVPFLLSLLMLPSHIMVATFAFIAFIVRSRVRAFLSLVQISHISAYSVQTEDIPVVLKTLNCPIAMLCKWTSLDERGDGEDGKKAWLRLQLHRLWMTQIREVNAMVNHNRAWFAFQAFAIIVQLIILYVSRFTASQVYNLSFNYQTRQYEFQPKPRNQIVDAEQSGWLIQLCLLSMYPVSALLMLSTARWHIDQTCTKLEALLEDASSHSESSKGTVLDKDVCNGEDSLGVLLAFCKASSENALQVFGFSMDFMSLMRYLFYIGSVFAQAVQFVLTRDLIV
jgi:hypothetical protein